ncbi:NIF3-like protein 1 [Patiria miniata]|uniref:NIF3-like protein 1 n=1 Tax=Patiria miniata TaxID=46514 RepID=A0A913ZY40_PATMI|nr:NIF3-like protein 1 [Patiria miniata]
MSCHTQRVGLRSFFRYFRHVRGRLSISNSSISKLSFSSKDSSFNLLNLSSASAFCAVARLYHNRTRNSCSQQKLTSGSFVKLPYLQSEFQQRISTSLSIIRSSSKLSKLKLKGMDLKDVLCALDKFAPTSLAESWDNVGLLVEPTPPHHVKTMFLTNDLTEEVLTEAIDQKSDFILAYHPPIFAPLKRLTMRNTKERIIVRAIEKRIAIYSPHTCYDAVKGGVNDWLAEGLGPCNVEPMKTSQKPSDSGWTHRIEYVVPDTSSLLLPLGLGTSVSQVSSTPTENGLQVVHCCNEQGLLSIMESMESSPEIKKTVQITKLEKLPTPGTGTGRICKLKSPVSIATAVQRVKNHLGLQHVQLALGSQKTQDSEVKTVAICAGSGASVLAGVPADVYLTGEMSHHDILAAVARGTSVILCNHSNTERGYLRVLKAKLGDMLNGTVNVIVSEVDADPLNVV